MLLSNITTRGDSLLNISVSAEVGSRQVPSMPVGFSKLVIGSIVACYHAAASVVLLGTTYEMDFFDNSTAVRAVVLTDTQ